MSSMEISEPGVYFKVPAVPPSSFRSTKTGSSPPRKIDHTNEFPDKSQKLFKDESSLNRTSFGGLESDTKSPPSSSLCKNQNSSYNQMSESLIDVSAYPDVTYTSLFDGTLLNRLHQITNMDHSLAATINEDVSSNNGG